MKKKQPIYSESENFEDFISRSRHLRRVNLGFTPAVFPYCYEYGERESSAWNMMSPTSLFFLFALDKGVNVFNIGNEEFRLEPGSIMIIPQEYAFTSHTFGHCIRHVLELAGQFLKNMEIAQGMDHPILLNTKDNPEILELIKTIGPLVDTDSPSNFCKIMGLTYELLGRLSCLIQKHGRGKTVIQQVLIALEEGGTKKENMDRLVQKLGISRSSIMRLVKKHIGMSPKEFCITARMKKAVCLLEYTKQSVKEIAFILGYCNPFYFTADFKRLMGRTPTDYRKQIKSLPYQRERNETLPFQNLFGDKFPILPMKKGKA